jgi:hypothetical protein
MSVVAEYASPDEVLEFLEKVQHGAGHLNAAYAVGWSPAKLRRLMSDTEFVEALNTAETQLIESIEEKAVDLALHGNTRMIELILFCKARDRGWRPPTQRIEHVAEGKVDVNIVASVGQAVREQLKAGTLAELPSVIDATAHDD